jgi:hypothetical protein
MMRNVITKDMDHNPWHPEWHYAAMAIAGIAIKGVAAHMPEHERRTMTAAVASAAAEWDEFVCGNGRPPGPRPHVFEAIAQLADFAESLPVGSSLRADVAETAGNLAQRAGAAMRSANAAGGIAAEK